MLYVAFVTLLMKRNLDICDTIKIEPMEWIFKPWNWYVAGPMIAFVMILLVMMGKNFGMSSNLRTLCTMCGAGKTSDFFKFDWRTQKWNLLVIVGAVLGGFIAQQWVSEDVTITPISEKTIEQLHSIGIMSAGQAYTPTELYGDEVWQNPKTMLILLAAGLFLGFGARYAGGCTSGHAISGLSNLQLPSLIAVIGFFIGGLLMTFLVIPYLF